MEFIIDFLMKDDALTELFIILAVFGLITNLYCYWLLKESTDRRIAIKERKDRLK